LHAITLCPKSFSRKSGLHQRFLVGLARAFAVEEHVDRLFHRARALDRTGIHEENLVGVLNGIQTVRDDDARRRCRQFTE